MVTACQDFDVEVCGREEYDRSKFIYPREYGSPYQKNEGGGSIQILTMAEYKAYYSLNYPRDTTCTIVSWAVYDKLGDSYIATDIAYLSTNIYVNTSAGTPYMPYPLYIVANTSGGVLAEQKFYVSNCGRERLYHNVTEWKKIKHDMPWTEDMGPIIQNFRDDFADCPIVAYTLLDANNATYAGTDVYLDSNLWL